MFDLAHLQDAVERFSLSQPADKSVVTLAGTGPNGACQVPLLSLFGEQYLQSLLSLNILSASSFSFFIFLANKMKMLNTDAFLDFENHTKSTHKFSLKKLGKNILSGKPKRNIYNNELIGTAVNHLYQREFTQRQLKDIPFPVTFYAFCLKRKKAISINSDTFPNMSVFDISRACISIPWIHGHFSYLDYHFIDPIFSDDFSSLRKSLFQQTPNHLYVNYKINQQRGNIQLLKSEDNRYPNITLIQDFIKFYLGIKNKRITETHQQIYQKGVICGNR